MKPFLVLALCLAAFQFSSAQQTIYFSKDTAAVKSVKKHSSERNVIKIAPLSFLFGTVPVFYEREINHFLSVQVGAGITTRNYLQEWANNLELGQTEYQQYKWNGVSEETYNFNPESDFANRKSSIGYCFSIQPRNYFESDGIEGSFVGFSFERAQYNLSSRRVQTGGDFTGTFEYTSQYFKEYDVFSDIAVNFGSQYMSDRIALEYTAGIALRKKDSRRYAYGYDTNSKVIDGFAELKKTDPAFQASIKVGYHF